MEREKRNGTTWKDASLRILLLSTRPGKDKSDGQLIIGANSDVLYTQSDDRFFCCCCFLAVTNVFTWGMEPWPPERDLLFSSPDWADIRDVPGI